MIVDDRIYTVCCYPVGRGCGEKCSICCDSLSGDVYSLNDRNEKYHVRCVIAYWEGLDKSKLKYRSIWDDYSDICNEILAKLEKKSLEKYGTTMNGLDKEKIDEFIEENMLEIKKFQLFQREIRYQQSKKKPPIQCVH